MFTKKNSITLFLIALLPLISNAQCAMCRAALQTEETGVPAEAVNDGIVYLMAFPYLLLIIVGWAVYKVVSKKNKNKTA